MEFNQYNTTDVTIQMRKNKIDSTDDKIIENNMKALIELGK